VNARRLAVAVALALAVSAPVAAAAQDYPGGTVPPNEVLGNQQQRGETLPTQAERTGGGTVAGAAENRTLPVTGGDLLGLSVLGAGLVGGGAVVVARTRRRPASA